MQQHRRIAILIGNQTWLPSSGLEPLGGPINDVDALADVLRDPALGKFDVCRLIDADRTRVLQEIELTLRDAHHGDTVLIFYAGHGKLDQEGRLCLATADTLSRLLYSTSIPAAHLGDIANQSACGTVVLLLDCCYSGAFGKSLSRGDAPSQLALLTAVRGFHVLSAATENQTASEAVAEVNGVLMGKFTRAIVRGIASGKADIDHDGDVSLSDLRGYLSRAISGQTPQYFAKGAVVDPIIASSPLGARAEALSPQRVETALEKEVIKPDRLKLLRRSLPKLVRSPRRRERKRKWLLALAYAVSLGLGCALVWQLTSIDNEISQHEVPESVPVEKSERRKLEPASVVEPVEDYAFWAGHTSRQFWLKVRALGLPELAGVKESEFVPLDMTLMPGERKGVVANFFFAVPEPLEWNGSSHTYEGTVIVGALALLDDHPVRARIPIPVTIEFSRGDNNYIIHDDDHTVRMEGMLPSFKRVQLRIPEYDDKNLKLFARIAGEGNVGGEYWLSYRPKLEVEARQRWQQKAGLVPTPISIQLRSLGPTSSQVVELKSAYVFGRPLTETVRLDSNGQARTLLSSTPLLRSVTVATERAQPVLVDGFSWRLFRVDPFLVFSAAPLIGAIAFMLARPRERKSATRVALVVFCSLALGLTSALGWVGAGLWSEAALRNSKELVFVPQELVAAFWWAASVLIGFRWAKHWKLEETDPRQW